MSSPRDEAFAHVILDGRLFGHKTYRHEDADFIIHDEVHFVVDPVRGRKGTTHKHELDLTVEGPCVPALR